MSKILEIHGFVEETILLLSVVPEFNKIEQILTEAQYYWGKYDQPDKIQYRNRYKFTGEFLKRLSDFAEANIRDEIVEKCTRLALKIAVEGNSKSDTDELLVKKQKDKRKTGILDRCNKIISNCQTNNSFMNFENKLCSDQNSIPVLSNEFRERIVEEGKKRTESVKNAKEILNRDLWLFQFMSNNTKIDVWGTNDR